LTELELIVDLHRNSGRQGPGSERDTLRALGFMNLPVDREYKIADIGCGTGSPTLTLAKSLKGHITAVDLFPEFLSELEEKARISGLDQRITTVATSMEELPFEREEYDLIWSEGAIYNMGFENGIKKWRDHLKPGGYLAVSELTWIRPSRPKEIEAFWEAEYPEISPASKKIMQLEKNGYALMGYFYLNPESWISNYYNSLEARFSSFLERHHLADLAQKVVEDQKTEIALYRKYMDYYSYGFYVARKDPNLNS